MRAFYSPDYVVDLGAHVFPTVKFARTVERLIADGALRPAEVKDPGAAGADALAAVHRPEWISAVFDGTVTLEQETRMELRWSPSLALAHRKCAAGTLAAARDALATGLGLHLGGGSHHAFAGHGEGFCVFNDLAFALAILEAEGALARGAVVDLDAHQGNGTAALLAGREGLSTFSIHGAGIYPFDGSGTPGTSTEDHALPAGTTGAQYHKILKERLPAFLDEAKPDLVLYQAGVDVHETDMLGRFSLDAEAVAERDRFVAEAVFARGAGLVVTLGGGYAEDPAETAALHARTVREAISAFKRKD